MTREYQQQFEQALSYLRKLEIDKALSIFYCLLAHQPNNCDLIRQIYQLEIRKKRSSGLIKIANHIFLQPDKSTDFHIIALECYRQVRERLGLNYFFDLNADSLLNLLYHLGQTNRQQDTENILAKLKDEQSEHPELAKILLRYCEQLINKNQYILAKKELEYLMIYYTEATTQQQAEKLYNQVSAGIRV